MGKVKLSLCVTLNVNHELRTFANAIAEELARDEKVGVYSGSHIEPWLWRKANK